MATSRSKTTCLLRSALKSAPALHENTSEAVAIGMHSCCCGKQNAVHAISAYACRKSATSLNSCSRMQEHLQVSTETKTAFPLLNPYCTVLLVTNIAGHFANNTQYVNSYRLLQSVTNNHNIVHMYKDSEHMCKMQPSTQHSHPYPGQNQSSTFQLLVNNLCCPLIVFKALHFKACSVSCCCTG